MKKKIHELCELTANAASTAAVTINNILTGVCALTLVAALGAAVTREKGGDKKEG